MLTIGHLTPPEGVRIVMDKGLAAVTVRPPRAEEEVAPATAPATKREVAGHVLDPFERDEPPVVEQSVAEAVEKVLSVV